jgi:indolepyruvate ferredoxin oxidoreductase
MEYQDAGYAKMYREFIDRVKLVEGSRSPGHAELSASVAHSLFKLMAYKYEYEVARLYTNGSFLRSLQEKFEGKTRLVFHLAPPILARKDPHTGHIRKRTYGAWMYHVLRLLARLKRLRGTKLDPFGYTRERRAERRLITDYRSVIDFLLENLSADNRALAVRIAEIPMRMRGFGHVKERNVGVALEEQATLERDVSVGLHLCAMVHTPRDEITHGDIRHGFGERICRISLIMRLRRAKNAVRNSLIVNVVTRRGAGQIT